MAVMSCWPLVEGAQVVHRLRRIVRGMDCQWSERLAVCGTKFNRRPRPSSKFVALDRGRACAPPEPPFQPIPICRKASVGHTEEGKRRQSLP